MTAPVDVQGILARAGADAAAPEGSQAWALAQVGAAAAELIASVPALIEIIDGAPVSLGAIRRAKAALARVGGAS